MLSSCVILSAVLAAPIATLEARAIRVVPDIPTDWSFGQAVASNPSLEHFEFVPGESPQNVPVEGLFHGTWTEHEYRIVAAPGTPLGTPVPVRFTMDASFGFAVSGLKNATVVGSMLQAAAWGSLAVPEVDVPFEGEGVYEARFLRSTVVMIPAGPANGQWETISAWVLREGILGYFSLYPVDPTLPASVDIVAGGSVQGGIQIVTVPEPATAALVGIGLTIIWVRRKADPRLKR